MRILHLTPCCDESKLTPGSFWDIDVSWTVLSPHDGETEVQVQTEKGLLCKVVRNAIPEDLCTLAVAKYKQVGDMVSTNRGFAAGSTSRKVKYSTFSQGNKAHSGIMGYIDSSNPLKPCRLTKFSRDHFDQFQEGLPFIQKIDECFRNTIPLEYQIQRTHAREWGYCISDTAFSTVTVNLNFRTALHKDRGDFARGFGNLVVCSENIRGGMLLFPRYKVAVELASGDFMAMDVHEWHCNSPITPLCEGGYRLAFVCYLREGMGKCKNVALAEVVRDREDIIRRIFEAVGDTVPERVVTGKGRQGEDWWTMESPRLQLTYKYRRYTLLDRISKVKTKNLFTSLEYVLSQDD